MLLPPMPSIEKGDSGVKLQAGATAIDVNEEQSRFRESRSMRAEK